MSKCHIVGNLMSQLILLVAVLATGKIRSLSSLICVYTICTDQSVLNIQGKHRSPRIHAGPVCAISTENCGIITFNMAFAS